MIFLRDHNVDGYGFLAFGGVEAFCRIGRYPSLVWIRRGEGRIVEVCNDKRESQAAGLYRGRQESSDSTRRMGRYIGVSPSQRYSHRPHGMALSV